MANEINEGFYNIWGDVKQQDITGFIKPGQPVPNLFNHTNIGLTLGKLKKSSPGPDEITAKLLKEASLEIVNPLVTLFAKCLEHSFIPAQWKNANITPIPKVPNPSTYHGGINLTSLQRNQSNITTEESI